MDWGRPEFKSLNKLWIASNPGTVFINFNNTLCPVHRATASKDRWIGVQSILGKLCSSIMKKKMDAPLHLQCGIYRTDPIRETFIYCKICILIFDQLTRREFAKDKPNLQCRQQQQHHQQQQQDCQQQQQQQRQHQNLSWKMWIIDDIRCKTWKFIFRKKFVCQYQAT